MINAERTLLSVSLLIPVRDPPSSLSQSLIQLSQFLRQNHGDQFEILLIPNDHPPQYPKTLEALELLVSQNPPDERVRVLKQPLSSLQAGKGAALKAGVLEARGKFILFTDADLPYHLEFFERSISMLERGFDFISGNRRLAKSQFNLPAQLLPLALQRHWLGKLFNRAIRFFFPITSSDTQAGIKAMTRDFAKTAFSRVDCPGFFFDIELFLVASRGDYAWAELPIELFLQTEKSTVRVLKELALAFYWVTRIRFRLFFRHYGSNQGKRGFLRRYQATPWTTRLFLFLRAMLTPYAQMAENIPERGKILDLGCGHGLFSLRLALDFPEREILAVDHDLKRVAIGRAASKKLPQIRWENSHALGFDSKERFSAIAAIDMLHYFDFSEQKLLLKRLEHLLSPDGALVIREVNPKPHWSSRWNLLYERLAVRLKFTQVRNEKLHVRTPSQWIQQLETLGFEVSSKRCSSVFFSDELFVCRKKQSFA